MARPLSSTQKSVYRAEKATNFRFLFSLLSRPFTAPHTLGPQDVVDEELVKELSDLSQYAEVACCSCYVRPGFLFENLELLKLPGFPLDDYPALGEHRLVSAFTGTIADLAAYCLYRPSTKQLIAAISGTQSPAQALYVVRFLKQSWLDIPGAQIHTGFALLYNGLRAQLKAAVDKGLAEHDIQEVVISGHSLGGALCYVLAMELLADTEFCSRGLRLTILTLGGPRAGNVKLVNHYRSLRDAYRSSHGEASLKEFPIRIWNDGVPALPPKSVGFAHFSESPFWYANEQLYAVPPNYGEYTSFNTPAPPDRTLKFPKGGHNYYHNRDMERFVRRMKWVVDAKAGTEANDEESWKDLYLAMVTEQEKFIQ